MRALLFILGSLIFLNSAKSQISLDYIEILNSTSRVTYVGVTYRPDYELFRPDFEMMERGLATLTQRYETNFKLIRNEYQKLMNLKLVNENNNQILRRHQAEVERWAKDNLSKYDLAQPQNTNNILEYITRVFKIQSIKDEIDILQGLSQLNSIIPQSSPLKDCRDQMYKNVQAFFDQLKTYTNYEMSRGFLSLYPEFITKITQEKGEKSEGRKKEIISKYASLTTFKNLTDGWHETEYVSVSPIENGTPKSWYQAGKMKVYILNNKVKMATQADGSAIEIPNGMSITKQKVDILYPSKKCSDASESLIPYTLYFFL